MKKVDEILPSFFAAEDLKVSSPQGACGKNVFLIKF